MSRQLSFEDLGDRSDVAAVQDFIEENPNGYKWFLNSAKDFADHGRRFSVKWLVEGYRWETRFKSRNPFKWNNSHTAALSRQLVKDAPEIEPYISMRKAGCDE